MQSVKHYSVTILLLLLFHSAVYAESPERIVSLDLCSDWMLLRYASASQQVIYSPLLYRYPLEWIPSGLPIHDGSLEQVLLHNPDLVIAGEFNATQLSRRLQQLGSKVVVMPLPLSLPSTLQYIEQFTAQINEPVTTESFLLQEYSKHGQKLLLLGANGIAAGLNTLENDILQQAGWSNYLQHSGFVSMDLEQLVANPPDAMVYSKPLSNSLANLFASHPALARITTQQNAMLAEAWRWQCPGPWTFDLVKELAQWQTN